MKSILQIISAMIFIIFALVWKAHASPPAAMNAPPSETKIGVVDMEKMMKTYPRAIKIRTDIEEEFNKQKKELEKAEDDLQTMEKDIEKKKAVLSEEALKQKQQDLQKRIMEFRERVTKSQMDLQKKQNELLSPVMEQIKKAITEVAKERGYALVQTKEANLVYVGQGLDITDDVVKSLDRKN